VVGYIERYLPDLVQGYLFDKPLPKAAFKQRLKNKVYE
jgi:EAL domain-containing protein (putative c-di-GMP-specific phosphodiesterase class I)